MRRPLNTPLISFTLLMFFLASLGITEQLMADPGEKFGASTTNDIQSWDDKSDELPGLTSTGTLLIIGAAIVGTFVVFTLLSKKGDKKDAGDQEDDEKAEQTVAPSLSS